MRKGPLPTGVDEATTTGGDASSDCVSGLRRLILLLRQVDVVVGPPVGDLCNGFVDRGPGFQAGLLWIGRVGRCGKGGQSFARAAERNREHSTMTIG